MQIAGSMNGAQKAAIVMLLLGEERSSEVFKHLHEDEIERIARVLAQIGNVDAKIGETVLEELHETMQAATYLARGGMEYAQRLLVSSVGSDAAGRILDRVVKSNKSHAGFAILAKADPNQLSKFILSERPQTIALILAQLHSSQAAQLITTLPDELRSDVVTRMAGLDEISPEVVLRISSVIEQQLKTLGTSSHEASGGVRAVAELLNRLERSISVGVLEGVESESPDLAVSIRNLMFVFEDLGKVEDTAMREVIQRVDRKVLPMALKGAAEEIRDRFFSNMSKRAGDMLQEEMDVMGAVRLREVEQAQAEIVAVARKLEEEGLLTTGAAAGEAYVI
jgi:flagellar motor switch protein FliG